MKRGRPSTSPAWAYFDDKKQCRYCDFQLNSAVSTNAKNHLKYKHPNIFVNLIDTEDQDTPKSITSRRSRIDGMSSLIQPYYDKLSKIPTMNFSKCEIPGDYYPENSMIIPSANKKLTMSLLPPASELTASATKFIQFLNKAVTPFHAIKELASRLVVNGFVELKESDAWDLKPSGRYYVTKNDSTIFAFAVGGQFKVGSGFSMVVGHSDSPSLRIKPISNRSSSKFLQVGVSTYGSGIWRTWFDRDLAVAGQVICKKNGRLHRVLVDSKEPVLFIPNLAIHLEPNREKQSCNNELELRPILCTSAMAAINGFEQSNNSKQCNNQNLTQIQMDHQPALLNLLAKLAECNIEDIIDLDLYLYDSQPAKITGLFKEFISSQRLDNLVGAYTSIEGLLSSLEDNSLNDEANIRIAAVYDNEEVGSVSAQGAESAFNEWCLRRIFNELLNNPTAFERGIGRSYLISADQAHACHPNYSDKHEDNHKPCFQGGIVVKINVNQRYATTSTTSAILKEIASKANVPLQQFVVRNDSGCGSTVGPMMATKLGVRTIDVGCPQLAMHSIREFADTSSIYMATKLYNQFYHSLPLLLDDFQF